MIQLDFPRPTRRRRSRRRRRRSGTASTRAPSAPPGALQARDRRRHAPGRLPGRRLARELLRAGALPRPERRAGRRLRRHDGRARELRPRLAVLPSDEAATAAVPVARRTRAAGASGSRRSTTARRGPNMKRKWTEPITWTDESWRDDATPYRPAPRSGRLRPDFFCGAVAAGSNVLHDRDRNPLPVVVALAGMVALVLWLASRTSWARPRRCGSRGGGGGAR